MWRVRRPDGTLTDMANLFWAKDAGASIGLAALRGANLADVPGTERGSKKRGGEAGASAAAL
jgi:hypothetical protein